MQQERAERRDGRAAPYRCSDQTQRGARYIERCCRGRPPQKRAPPSVPRTLCTDIRLGGTIQARSLRSPRERRRDRVSKESTAGPAPEIPDPPTLYPKPQRNLTPTPQTHAHTPSLLTS